MFNLDQSIAEWRRQMTAGGIKSRETLDELESHLREDVEQQTRSGVSAEQAFHEAVARMGSAEKVRGEFAKVDPPHATVRLKLLHVCCAAIAMFMVLIETWTLLAYEISRAERVFGITFVLLVASYVGALPYLNRTLFPGVRGWTLRNTLGIVCNYGGALWVSLALLSTTGVVNLEATILFNVAGWSLLAAATATVCVLAYGTDGDLLRLWSPAVKHCFEAAREEALGFHHDFIGTEHVLLGLLEADGIVPKVLGKMGVNRETVRTEIEKIVGSGPQCPAKSKREPVYTPRAKKAIRLAMKEAHALKRECVDAEHIFLGLLLEGGGVAALVLEGLGVSPDGARREILNELRLA